MPENPAFTENHASSREFLRTEYTHQNDGSQRPERMIATALRTGKGDTCPDMVQLIAVTT